MFSAAYMYRVVSSHLYLRRIGSIAAAERITSVGFVDLFIIRSFELIAIPLCAYIIFILYSREYGLYTGSTSRSSLKIAAIALGVSFFSIAFINSRLSVVLGTAMLVGGVVLSKRHLHLRLRGVALLSCLGGFLIIAMLMVVNLRTVLVNREPLTDLWKPMDVISGRVHAVGAHDQWVGRTDCLDLIKQMHPSLMAKGYEWGEAWKVPITVMVGQLVMPQEVRVYKRTGITTAKAYLIEEHTGLGTVDYYSCPLTDAYGNFSFLGFIGTGILLGCLLYGVPLLIHRRIKGATAGSILIGMVWAWHLLKFEQALVVQLVAWVRYLPILWRMKGVAGKRE